MKSGMAASQQNGEQSGEVNLLPQWREPVSGSRIARAVAGAVLYHVLAFLFLIFAPGPGEMTFLPRIDVDIKRAVPLYIPKELTQREPNKGQISHSLDVRSAPPPGVTAMRIPVAPIPAPIVTPPVPSPKPVPAPEPPKAEVTPPAAATPAPPPPAPPRPVPNTPLQPEKPKLAFESVGPPAPIQPAAPVNFPGINKSVDEIARGATAPPSPPGAVSLGDRDASRLQLLSDPSGVDFKPYLIQVLTAVRTNWMAIIPEAARAGRRGRVLVQFIIDRRGHMPKIVIAEESGTLAFDRAAIAGVNAAVPFPPLPDSFKGQEIRLQLAFTYNTGR